MRTEQEMMELILDVARKDARIRAVYLSVPCATKTHPGIFSRILISCTWYMTFSRF